VAGEVSPGSIHDAVPLLPRRREIAWRLIFMRFAIEATQFALIQKPTDFGFQLR
jgi:hypothetical protein